jgi:23S rRNA pseudouridine2605 synthase
MSQMMNKTKKQTAFNSESMSLSKHLALSGIASRRASTQLVKDGLVMVNGQIVKEPGYKLKSSDTVLVQGKTATVKQQKVYILLNKPKDYITTLADERDRKTVKDLLGDQGMRVYPVGRLDRNTTGLLLMTNDGDLAQKLAHPKYEVTKVYHVALDTLLKSSDLDRIRAGIELEDGLIKVDDIRYVPEMPRNNVRITLHSGKYRIVRRLFEHIGYEVIGLDRTGYAGLTKKNLLVGKWRHLTEPEIIMLKSHGAKKIRLS